jgi:hypothetical protein
MVEQTHDGWLTHGPKTTRKPHKHLNAVRPPPHLHCHYQRHRHDLHHRPHHRLHPPRRTHCRLHHLLPRRLPRPQIHLRHHCQCLLRHLAHPGHVSMPKRIEIDRITSPNPEHANLSQGCQTSIRVVWWHKLRFAVFCDHQYFFLQDGSQDKAHHTFCLLHGPRKQRKTDTKQTKP